MKDSKQTAVPCEINIELALQELFAIRGEQADLKSRESAIVDEINGFCDKHINDFEDNELPLDAGIIKIQNNPPKLVHIKSEKAVTTKERNDLLEVLSQEYVEQKPNMTKMLAKINADKSLKKALDAKGFQISQTTKYAIKSY